MTTGGDRTGTSAAAEVTDLGALIREEVPVDDPVNPAHFTRLVSRLARAEGVRDVLEVGGGRTPLLAPDQWESLGLTYWVNDISRTELDHVDERYETTCFDIAGDDPDLPWGRFDLLFSRSVLEHVADTDRALANSARLLRPGGIMIHTFPTLYNPVFVANKLMPSRLSAAVLRRVVGYTYEKFPAHYHRTTSSRSQVQRLVELGFAEAAVVPFWGHGYLHFLPPLYRAEARVAALAARRDWRWYSTFAYLAGRRAG